MRSYEPAADLGETLMDALAPWGGAVVDATISRLTPSLQQIATMRCVDDLQLGEIAKVNGTSIAAVSQRLATIHRTVALALAA
jgi:DNA-directed RNA polymerase specialized sigma24 family protein